jgi:hypothetical protein
MSITVREERPLALCKQLGSFPRHGPVCVPETQGFVIEACALVSTGHFHLSIFQSTSGVCASLLEQPVREFVSMPTFSRVY